MVAPMPPKALHTTARALARRCGVLAVAALLAACASGPQRPSAPDRDAPEAKPPTDLARVPDAEPKPEPIRPGGPNKPYDVLGRSYVPITKDAPFTQRGIASWYGPRFHGKRTASGEVYNMYAMTAAHPTLPIPSYARVRNPANGREVVLRINDRGPFVAGRIVDLSYTAALKLDLLRGIGPVELQRITSEDIRTGAWRRDAGGDAVRVAGTGTEAVAPATAPVPVSALISTEPALAAAAPLPAAVGAPSPPAMAAASSSSVANGTPPAEVADAPAARAYTAPAHGFWVQLGAFRARDGAESFQKRVAAEMDWLAPLLAVFSDAPLFRLQAGPYPSRDEARNVAERVRDGLQLVPTIVERR
jgi:rare lipoprotein A